MRLVELTIRRGDTLIRRIEFKKGLNLILDKPAASATRTGNSIGKTTVLRLIDCCLGSEAADIWQDPEFKIINQEVYDFLHGAVPVLITLTLDDPIRGQHTLFRSFEGGNRMSPTFHIDSTTFVKEKAYREALKEILFGYGGAKPTMRQLAPKFVRSSPTSMSKTLKFLGEYARETDYEALHLFLFGFFAVNVLEERPRLATLKKKYERDRKALTRTRKKGEMEQLILHLRREIEHIEASHELRADVPEIATRASQVTQIRSQAIQYASALSRYDSEIAGLKLAVNELEGEFSNVDGRAIEVIYKDAQRYLPKLQHDWEELKEFILNLRKRKQRFLEDQIASLEGKATAAKDEINQLQQAEKDAMGTLVTSPEFVKALEMRSDLQDKYKQLGSLEQDLRDVEDLDKNIAATAEKLETTRLEIEQQIVALRDRVDVFNTYFSALSKELYGEEYLLHFDETSKGSLVFSLSAVGANVGAGKKATQTAAFDLAYIKFLWETGINFPTFVCHDGIEQIHGNQQQALLVEAAAMDGQLVVATLRDKLPPMSDEFIQAHTIIELADNDKLFKL
jgi:uncharacterized protein YydD (DUF2326 family)